MPYWKPFYQNILPILICVIVLTGCQERCDVGNEVENVVLELMDSIEKNSMTHIDSIAAATCRKHTDSTTFYTMEGVRASKFYKQTAYDSMNVIIQNIKEWTERQQKPLTHRQNLLLARLLALDGKYRITGKWDIEAAIDCYKASYDVVTNDRYATPGDKVWVATNLADIYKQGGQYDKAIELYEEALAEADSTDSEGSHASVYMGIALAYTSIADYERSSIWWDKVKGLWEHLTPQERFLYYNNRGTDYFGQEKYRECRECLLKALKMIKQEGLSEWEEMFIKTNLADVYIKTGEYEKAKELIPQAEGYFRKAGFDIPLHYLHTQRMELKVLEKQNPLTAEEEKRIIADDLGKASVPELEKLRLKVLMRKYAEEGDTKKLLAAAHTLGRHANVMHNNNLRMQLSTITAAFEHNKKLLEQERKIEQKSDQLIISLAISVALMMLVAAVIAATLMYRRRRQAMEATLLNNILLLRMENARNRVSPHFLGNAMSNIMATERTGITERMTTLAALLQKSQELSAKIHIPLSHELAFVKDYVAFMSFSLQPNFCFDMNIEEGIDTEKTEIPSMAIQIFVENAIKHGLKAMPPQAEKQLVVSVTKEDDNVRIAVRNNGKKMTDDGMTNENTGLKIIRQTITMLNRQYSTKIRFGIGNEKDGFCSWIVIPNTGGGKT